MSQINKCEFSKIFGNLSSTVDKLHDLNWTFEIRSKKFVLRCRDLYLQNTWKLPNQTSYAQIKCNNKEELWFVHWLDIILFYSEYLIACLASVFCTLYSYTWIKNHARQHYRIIPVFREEIVFSFDKWFSYNKLEIVIWFLKDDEIIIFLWYYMKLW